MEGLSIICAGLGTIEEDDNGNRIGYSKGEYCLDNLKDLLRFLRRDDPQTREVFKQVCKWNIVGKDLIPIIEYCQDDRNLVLNAVKVLVFLSMPVEPQSDDIPQQIEYLWGIKSSVTCSDSIPVIMSLLESPLENLENESFTEDDWKLAQLVLTLFRNILAIQQIPMQQKAGGSATHFLSLRDKFLERLFHENVMEVILVLTQHVGGSNSYLRQDNLLLLEIFHYIFMDQDPELVAKVYLRSSEVDENPETSLNSLKCIMEEEQQKRKLNRLRVLGCNSQFTGTFTRLTLDGSKQLFKGNPCSASHDVLLKAQKDHRGPSKRMVQDYETLPTAKNKILESLHDFVNQLLSGGYNVLAESIREDIEREHHAIQNSDVIIFFQVACFVTSFQYHKVLTLKPSTEADAEASTNHHDDNTLFKGSICGPIAESLNESMFLLVISKWRYGFDGLKQTNDYKSLSAAGSLLKIMIRMLDLVLKQSGEDSMEPKTARVLLYKLCYDQTEDGMTQFLLNMIKSFDKHKQAKSYLADLVECIHVLVRLVENLQKRGSLRVSKKSRKKKVKNKGNNMKDNDDAIDTSRKTDDEIFGNIAATQNEVDGSGHEQSVDMGMLGTEEKTIHSSDLNEDKDTSIPLKTEDVVSERLETEKKTQDDTNEDLHHGTDDSSGDEQLVSRNEVDFKISTLISSLANNNIIKNLCWLLKFYKSNSLSTNHYIIYMLCRICDDLDLSPMLYQLSLLTTFYNILDEQKSRPCKEYENIVSFLTSLVRRMLRKMKKCPLLFVEVLFWKTRNECRYINCESMLHELSSLKQGSGRSTSHGNGEIGLSEGQGWVRRSIADALGDDEADFVISHEDGQRNEDSHEANQNFGEGKEIPTSVSNEGTNGEENSEKEQNSFEPQSKSVRKRRKPLVPNDELEGKIKDLFEKYRDDPECCHLIAKSLGQDGDVSPIQVSRMLKQLGYKLPPKKKTSNDGDNNQFRDKLSNLDTIEESVSLRKHLHTRKRVRAFSEDQEQKIKDLFEQFKNHKKCSYMIANALDAEGKFSTAQISRKLKQLGLRVPKKKKSDTNLHLRDEALSDISTPGNSDDETLVSLKRRSQILQNDGEDEHRPSQKTKKNLSQDDSDEEPISSILVKTRKPSLKAKNKKSVANSDAETTSQNEFASGDTPYSRRDEESQPNEVGAAATADTKSDLAGNAETSATGNGSRKQTGFVNEPDPLQQQQQQILQDDLDDELADFTDDASPVASRTLSVPRRQLRMVIEPEDDE